MGLFGKKKDEKAAQGKSERGTGRQAKEQLQGNQKKEEQPQKKREHTEQMASSCSREGQEPVKQQEGESQQRHIQAEMAVPAGQRVWQRLGGLRGQGQPGICE